MFNLAGFCPSGLARLYPEAFCYRYTSLGAQTFTTKKKKKIGLEKSDVNKFILCYHKIQQVQNHKRVNLTIKFDALFKFRSCFPGLVFDEIKYVSFNKTTSVDVREDSD